MKMGNRFNSRRVSVFLFGTAIVVLLVAVLIHRDAERVTMALTKPQEDILDLSLVVNQIRGLNRLETAAMRVTHVGTISQSYTLIPNLLAGDELTLYSVGDVIAGVDLAQLQPDDIRREPNGAIVIHLPAASILVSRLDNRQTHIVSRRTGIFRRADQQLEARGRQYAEISIRNEAVHRGILTLAQQNAEQRIAILARSLGAKAVVFAERPANPERPSTLR
jgi:Protein of unknown function (DUF4230)